MTRAIWPCCEFSPCFKGHPWTSHLHWEWTGQLVLHPTLWNRGKGLEVPLCPSYAPLSSHLLLNKVHDVLEVQIIVVILNSSPDVVVQKVNGLYRRRNCQGKGTHIRGHPWITLEVQFSTEARSTVPTYLSRRSPPYPTLNTWDCPAHRHAFPRLPRSRP